MGRRRRGLATFFGYRDGVEFLLDRGAQIDTRATNSAFPFTRLHSAISAGHKAIVDLCKLPRETLERHAWAATHLISTALVPRQIVELLIGQCRRITVPDD